MFNSEFLLKSIKRKINFTLITALLLSTMLLPQANVFAEGDPLLILENEDTNPDTATLDLYVEDTLQITVENLVEGTHSVLIEKYTTPDKLATAPMNFAEVAIDENTAGVLLHVDNYGEDDSDFTPGYYVVKVINSADSSVLQSQDFNVRSRFTDVQVEILNPDELGAGGELVFTTTYELKNSGSFEAAPQEALFPEIMVQIADAEGNLVPGYSILSSILSTDLYSIENGTYTVKLNESFAAGETYTILVRPVEFNFAIDDDDYGTLSMEPISETDFSLINILGASLTPDGPENFIAGSTFQVTTTFELQDGEGTNTVNTVPSQLFELDFYYNGNGLTPVEIPEGVGVIEDLGNGVYNITLQEVFTTGNYAFTLEPATDELVKPWDSIEFNVYPALLSGIAENLSADFSPTFVPTTLDYTLSATNGESEIILTIDPAFENTTIQVASDKDAEVSASAGETNDTLATIDLAVGSNTITVTANETGNEAVKQIYTFVITRAEAGGGGGGNDDDDDEAPASGGGGGGAPDPVNNNNDSDNIGDNNVETLSEDEEETEFVECLDTEIAFADIEGHWAQSYIEVLADAGVVNGKTQVAFEPNDILTRAEAAKVVLCGMGYEIEINSAADFPDTDGHWADDIIATARERGIVHGYEDGTFRPNVGVSRAEILVMLLNAKNISTGGSLEAKFSDLDRDAWYADAVDFAFEHGIVNGYGNGTFGPHNKVTRGEMAKMAVLISQL